MMSRKYRVSSAIVLAFFICGLANVDVAIGQVRSVNGKRYEFVRGNFTAPQAFAEARKRGGYAVVFETMTEHAAVSRAFGLGTDSTVCWTGHYQKPEGREPGLGWTTIGNRPSAPLRLLFNSNGPDDGVRKKWGFESNDDGFTVWYGDSDGKDEDYAVCWKDRNGLLEDISVNFRSNLLIEY